MTVKTRGTLCLIVCVLFASESTSAAFHFTSGMLFFWASVGLWRSVREKRKPSQTQGPENNRIEGSVVKFQKKALDFCSGFSKTRNGLAPAGDHNELKQSLLWQFPREWLEVSTLQCVVFSFLNSCLFYFLSVVVCPEDYVQINLSRAQGWFVCVRIMNTPQSFLRAEDACNQVHGTLLTLRDFEQPQASIIAAELTSTGKSECHFVQWIIFDVVTIVVLLVFVHGQEPLNPRGFLWLRGLHAGGNPCRGCVYMLGKNANLSKQKLNRIRHYHFYLHPWDSWNHVLMWGVVSCNLKTHQRELHADSVFFRKTQKSCSHVLCEAWLNQTLKRNEENLVCGPMSPCSCWAKELPTSTSKNKAGRSLLTEAFWMSERWK